MIKSKRQNNIKLTTLMIAMTAAARQVKPANVNTDGSRRIPLLSARSTALFMNSLILLMLYKWPDTSVLTKCCDTNTGRRESDTVIATL